MKIPTPQELAGEQAPIVQSYVNLLAEQLRTIKPYGGRCIIDKHGVPFEHQKAVAAEFVKHGWAVAWRDDQRDGASVEFRAMAPLGAQGQEYLARVGAFITASPLVYDAARSMWAWLGSAEGMAAVLRLAGQEPDPTRAA